VAGFFFTLPLVLFGIAIAAGSELCSDFFIATDRNQMIDEADLSHLRKAIAASRSARDRGNAPYGAVLVDADGNRLAIAENTQIVGQDCTGHAETNLVRSIGTRIDGSVLKFSTLYASGEPCAMCAGAILNVGIGRVVFALGQARMCEISASTDGIAIGAGELLARAQPKVIVEGPVLEDKAAQVLLGN
jgi:tRNA(adenine34) deaminase